MDWYLEFVAGQCRSNTLPVVAFDLKAFFLVFGKDPVQVTAADVFEFLADQRGNDVADRARYQISSCERGRLVTMLV